MATLVLGAVGSVVGGPVGGAIGAAIGSSVDRAVLRPARRQGPRLTELALQTSSYGTQVPKVFGTMRVGGTVVWATDLVETRVRTGGGKGRATTESYAYAASFAVLLSARAVLRVGRVWADGKLLRGAAGDMKVAGVFRLHAGGEDQPVDPLIASAEGPTPAYRGCAYVVFEQLALGDYGNRIPQMSFEVVADEQPMPVARIARALASEVEGADGFTVDGFAASGGSVRAVLETLAQAAGAWFAPLGARLAMTEPGAGNTVLADAGVEGPVNARAVAAADTVPASVSVGHHDPARDWQAGVQRAVRARAGWRDERVDVPAALSAEAARMLAEAMLARTEAARTRRTLALGFEGLGVTPGARVGIAGERGVWRVASVSVEGMASRGELVPLTRAPVAVAASAGRVAAAADLVAGPTVLHAFETPALDDTVLDAPRLTVVARGGPGWRRAALLYSLDEGANWIEAGTTAAAATIGVVEAMPVATQASIEDRAGAMLVRLADGAVLHDADTGAIDAGANLALVDDELVQFARAVPLGGGLWRLTGLLRARRGTIEGSGGRFVLMEAEMARTLTLPVAAIGTRVRVMASGIGDDAPVETAVVLTGASVRPPSPAHLRVERDLGGAVLRWTRRSRAGWRWIDGVDAPLAEERELYRVTIEVAAGARVAETAVPMLALASGEAADGVRVSVVQQGTLAASAAAAIVIGGEGV